MADIAKKEIVIDDKEDLYATAGLCLVGHSTENDRLHRFLPYTHGHGRFICKHFSVPVFDLDYMKCLIMRRMIGR